MTFPDIDTISTYGGALVDFSPVADPTTDRSAAGMNSALETVAQMSRLAWRAIARVTLGTSPVLAYSDAGWGNANPPVPAHVSTGLYSITWPSTIDDSLGASHALLFRYALPKFQSSGTFPGFAFPLIYSANVVRVYTFDTTFALADLTGKTLDVLVG